MRTQFGKVELETIGDHRRSVIFQLDGSPIPADECTCLSRRDLFCPIDAHAIEARQFRMLEEIAMWPETDDDKFVKKALEEYREKNPSDQREIAEMELSTLKAILAHAQRLKAAAKGGEPEEEQERRTR